MMIKKQHILAKTKLLNKAFRLYNESIESGCTEEIEYPKNWIINRFSMMTLWAKYVKFTTNCNSLLSDVLIHNTLYNYMYFMTNTYGHLTDSEIQQIIDSKIMRDLEKTVDQKSLKKINEESVPPSYEQSLIDAKETLNEMSPQDKAKHERKITERQILNAILKDQGVIYIKPCDPEETSRLILEEDTKNEIKVPTICLKKSEETIPDDIYIDKEWEDSLVTENSGKKQTQKIIKKKKVKKNKSKEPFNKVLEIPEVLIEETPKVLEILEVLIEETPKVLEIPEVLIEKISEVLIEEPLNKVLIEELNNNDSKNKKRNRRRKKVYNDVIELVPEISTNKDLQSETSEQETSVINNIEIHNSVVNLSDLSNCHSQVFDPLSQYRRCNYYQEESTNETKYEQQYSSYPEIQYYPMYQQPQYPVYYQSVMYYQPIHVQPQYYSFICEKCRQYKKLCACTELNTCQYCGLYKTSSVCTSCGNN